MAPENTIAPIDCACVIHGSAYDWTYVERLYNMLNRNITMGARLHVYTEATRPVPAHMIKHELTEWSSTRPVRGWWYKMQLFNTAHHSGPLLYFDLDTVIVDNIDWICNLPLRYFWGVQDFKYLWKPNYQSINSSIMWWDTQNFSYVWTDFEKQHLEHITKKYRGDQDYIAQVVDHTHMRFLDSERIKSWRWQCLNNGYDFKRSCYRTPGAGTVLNTDTSVLVFHGNPKPSNIQDPVIDQHWK
jgi:hypothetical protein